MGLTPSLRTELEELLLDYVDAADRLDAAAVARLFADASVTFAGITANGQAQVQAVYSEVFATAQPVRHLVSNVRSRAVESTGTDLVARLQAAYMRWPVTPASDPLGLGAYDLEAHHDGTAWRVSRFEVRRLWTN